MSVNGYRPEVLVSDGGVGQARSTLATVRALAAAGYSGVVTTSGRHSVAAASRHCLRSVEVPKVTDSGYADAIESELAGGSYLTFLAAGDAALLALGADVERLVDKSLLAVEAERVGLSVAPGRVFDSMEQLLNERDGLEYPVVLKPATPGPRVRRIKSGAELSRAERDAGAWIVQPYITDRLRAVGGVIYDGRLVASAHQRYLRTWPSDCGGACAAETTEPDLELEERIVELLAGFNGVFQAQFAGDYLLDLNLRVYGSLPLATRAGANLPGVYCDILQGKVPAKTVRARPGVFFRWLEGDLRNVFEGVRERELSAREAFQLLRFRPGAAHGPESLKDPKPMIARLLYASKSTRRRNRSNDAAARS